MMKQVNIQIPLRMLGLLLGLFLSVGAFAQIEVKGHVKDATGEPIIGATVRVDGTQTATVSDFDGNFVLKANEGANITISYVGYQNQTVKAAPNLVVTLQDDAQVLENIVVIGYGRAKKNDLTGSVTAIKPDELSKGITNNATDMLVGKVAGVDVITSGGTPGAGAQIRIRGGSSLNASNDPLYVIDGLTIDGNTATGMSNILAMINPNDIETFTVLKDASATAIYGSRASNGVIIITTKKGKKGSAPRVSYNGDVTISTVAKKYDALNATEYRNLVNSIEGLDASKLGNADTNWQDEIFRTSFSNSHNLTLSGGTKKSSYRASIGYQDQQGIIKTSSMQKYNGRFYLATNLLNDRVKLELNTTVSRIDQRRVPIGESGGAEGDIIYNALRTSPTFPIFGTDGKYFQYNNSTRNPVAMINLTRDKTQTDRAIFNATATVDLVKGLKYKFNIAFDEMKATRKVEQKEELVYLDDGGVFTTGNVEAHNLLIENYFTYNLNLNDQHKFDFLLGHSYQRTRDYSYGYDEDGFYIDDIGYRYDLSLSKKKDQISGSSDVTINELQSFFGRINYNYMDRYLATMNMRADGSTKFGENNRYGFFPSAALAWRASEEEFIKNLGVFSNLKVRASWGITGNQEIPSKISHMLLGSTGKSAIFGVNGSTTPGITLTRTPNPDLKWEKTNQWDAGIDFGVLGGRLWGSIDYYDKTTKDVLLQVPSASPAPTTYVWQNIKDMKIKNHGWEFTINGRIIDKRDLTWEMGVNLSTISNKVEDLPVEYLTTGKPSGPGLDGETAQVIRSGYPIGTFWGKVFEGFDADGKSVFKKDEDGKDVEEKIGCAQPDFTLGLSTTVRWRNFDLTANFNGVFGNDVYNNLANVVDNRAWQNAGHNVTKRAANDTREALGNPEDYSSRYIEDGSYFRLSNLTLGYNVPLKSNKWLSGLYVYVNGTNLFCITDYSGYDPEVNASRVTNGVPALGIGWTQYPMARTFSFGMKLDF